MLHTLLFSPCHAMSQQLPDMFSRMLLFCMQCACCHERKIMSHHMHTYPCSYHHHTNNEMDEIIWGEGEERVGVCL